MADMKKIYDDLIIINLYRNFLSKHKMIEMILQNFFQNVQTFLCISLT